MRLPKTHSTRDRQEQERFLPGRTSGSGSGSVTPGNGPKRGALNISSRKSGGGSSNSQGIGNALDRLSESSRRYFQQPGSAASGMLDRLPKFPGSNVVYFVGACFILLFGVIKFTESASDTRSGPVDSSPPLRDLDFTLENIVSASIGLSQMAAAEILRVKKQHKEETQVKGKTLEGVDEPVTVADRESNRVFINGFETLFGKNSLHAKHFGNDDGELQLVSEETNPEKKEKIVPPLRGITFPGGSTKMNKQDTLIIIDPLDATKEFTEEVDQVTQQDMLPWVTTLVCVVHKGIPIAGVINRPFVAKEPVIWAVSTDEAKEVHPSDLVRSLVNKNGGQTNGHRVIFSRSHAGAVEAFVKEERHIEDAQMTQAGGAGFKAFAVAIGQADAYVHTTQIKTWDLCAGHALLSAAGGTVTDKDGQPLVYSKEHSKFDNGLVAVLDTAKLKDFTEGLSASQK